MDNTDLFENKNLLISGKDETKKYNVSILGSTGSIGKSTLSVLSLNKNKFKLFAVSANTNAKVLLSQCINWKPKYAVIYDPSLENFLIDKFKQHNLPTTLLVGEEGLQYIASDPEVDIVMAAIVGSIGLTSCLAAIKASKKILLANKESLIMAGNLFMKEVELSNSILLPVDSEHNAIFQCISGKKDGLKKIILTGSGGPFRKLPLSDFQDITPNAACKHPNWSMGKKISVDSSTMMNKALELIEAYWLFGLDEKFIDIVIHPQSIIHSMIEYKDGSYIAQLGQPDMRIPIANALAWPNRIESGAQSINWETLGGLTFESPDLVRFPSLKIVRQVMSNPSFSPIIFNAANEVAVDNFLSGSISYTDIINVIEYCLEKISCLEPTSLDEIKEIDRCSREAALFFCKKI
tara:strand:- start:955 stop:2175 length:1221 start_codon:yes stop_codon:yes gene_type:complete